MHKQVSFKYIGSIVGDILDEGGNVKSGIESGATQTISMRDEYGNEYFFTLKYYTPLVNTNT